MPWDLALDPITGDFIDDGRGGWLRTVYSDTSVIHQLECHYNAWWADPELGSRLHDRDLFTAAPARLVEEEMRRALGRLVLDGRIADLEVAAVEAGAGRVDGQTRYRDVATDQRVSATLPALRGTP